MANTSSRNSLKDNSPQKQRRRALRHSFATTFAVSAHALQDSIKGTVCPQIWASRDLFSSLRTTYTSVTGQSVVPHSARSLPTSPSMVVWHPHKTNCQNTLPNVCPIAGDRNSDTSKRQKNTLIMRRHINCMASLHNATHGGFHL